VFLVVFLVALPVRAHDVAIEPAAHLRDLMARFLPELPLRSVRKLWMRSLPGCFDQQWRGSREAGNHCPRGQALADDASYRETGPGPTAARAALVPLPEAFQSRLGPWLETASADMHAYAGDVRHRRMRSHGHWRARPSRWRRCAARGLLCVLRQRQQTRMWGRLLNPGAGQGKGNC
jgi:hypothetical protein